MFNFNNPQRRYMDRYFIKRFKDLIITRTITRLNYMQLSIHLCTNTELKYTFCIRIIFTCFKSDLPILPKIII